MLRKILIIISMLAIAAALAGCGDLPRSAVAQVNDKVITRNDLDQALDEYRQQFGEENMPAEGTEDYDTFVKGIVKRLVDEEILWFEAEKMGIEVSAEEVDSEVEKTTMQAGGEDELQKILDDSDITMDRFRESVRESLLFQKIYPEVTKDVPPVTEEEARAFYDENPDQFQVPEMREVSHILVKSEEEANTVRQRLLAGEDFATVAREVSTDPGSKDNGGSLGEVPSENSGLVPEFEAAMNQLQVGEISEPVKTQFGFHIILVKSITPAGTQSFEDVLEDLKTGLLLEAQRKAFDAWLNGVRGDYDIVYADAYRPDETTTGGNTDTTAGE